MDLRAIVRENPDHVVGHEPVLESLNVHSESKRFGIDPLEPIINQLKDSAAITFYGDIGRYLEAFSSYSLCIERCLNHVSLRRRFRNELEYHPHYKPYSRRQTQIANKIKLFGQYLELDYQNLIIHACILLDRTIAISRRFIFSSIKPSFTSFSKHIDFFSKNSDLVEKELKEYHSIIISCLDWYTIPLKLIRDKYLMHSAERHMSIFGWGKSKWDLEMITVIPAKLKQEKLLERVKFICFSSRRLAREIESFLNSFAGYWHRTN